jgi:hypothetical protein
VSQTRREYPADLVLTHEPSAASYSPAVTEGNDPTTVVSLRCPLVFTRRTQKPLSSLWKVTRSMTPEISSVEGLRSRDCGIHAWGFIFQWTVCLLTTIREGVLRKWKQSARRETVRGCPGGWQNGVTHTAQCVPSPKYPKLLEVSEAPEGCELCGGLSDNGDVAAQRLGERCADAPSASLTWREYMQPITDSARGMVNTVYDGLLNGK